jgi:hypothetical protein
MSRWLPLIVTSLACSSGGGDLNQLHENPKILGNPIAQQAAPATRLKDGSTIRARGVVVVAVDNYDDSGQGAVGDIYVQDPVQTGPKGTPWSGLRLYRPTKNPPDLELAPGQGVDLVGEFIAFPGPPGSAPFGDGIFVPQASNGALSLTYEGRPPEPVDLTLDDVKDPKVGMQYASRLVRFKNVTLTADFAGARPEATIYDTSKSLVLSAKLYPVHLDTAVNAKKGVTLKSVTGVLDYFYNMKLCPRSRADIEL